MTPGQVVELVVILLGFAATVAGLVIALARVIDPWVARWEARHVSRRPDVSRARSRWS